MQEEIMSQGDNIYDLIDVRDSQHLSRELAVSNTMKTEERSFVMRINCNRTMKRHLQYQKVNLLSFASKVQSVVLPMMSVKEGFSAKMFP